MHTVLLVEDKGLVKKVHDRMLIHAGYNVVTAAEVTKSKDGSPGSTR